MLSAAKQAKPDAAMFPAVGIAEVPSEATCVLYVSIHSLQHDMSDAFVDNAVQDNYLWTPVAPSKQFCSCMFVWLLLAQVHVAGEAANVLQDLQRTEELEAIIPRGKARSLTA